MLFLCQKLHLRQLMLFLHDINLDHHESHQFHPKLSSNSIPSTFLTTAFLGFRPAQKSFTHQWLFLPPVHCSSPKETGRMIFYHLVFVEHFQMKKVPVMIDLTCQCNYIWNQLKPTLPGVPASNFINRDYLKQEDPP